MRLSLVFLIKSARANVGAASLRDASVEFLRGKSVVDVFLQPFAVLHNRLPVGLRVVADAGHAVAFEKGGMLEPGEEVLVFSNEVSLVFTFGNLGTWFFPLPFGSEDNEKETVEPHGEETAYISGEETAKASGDDTAVPSGEETEPHGGETTEPSK